MVSEGAPQHARVIPGRKPLAGYQFDEIIVVCPVRQVSAI